MAPIPAGTRQTGRPRSSPGEKGRERRSADLEERAISGEPRAGPAGDADRTPVDRDAFDRRLRSVEARLRRKGLDLAAFPDHDVDATPIHEQTRYRLEVFPRNQMDENQRLLQRIRYAQWPRIEGCLTVLYASRAGSSHLARELAARYRIGRMEEAFNPHMVEGIASANIIRSFANDWFSVKLSVRDAISAELCGVFNQYIDISSFILLYRRDIVGQAISSAKAKQTGQWHSINVAKGPAHYDGVAIADSLRSVATSMEILRAYVARTGRPWRPLFYEDFEHGDFTAAETVCDAFGVPRLASGETGPKMPPLTRTADDVNVAWKARFMEEMSPATRDCVSRYLDALDHAIDPQRGPSAVLRQTATEPPAVQSGPSPSPASPSASLTSRLGSAVLWRMIDGEAAAWKRAGRAPVLWWRDDDARRPSVALDRLLDLSRAHQAPLALAVIPDGELSDLADAIAGHSLVSVIQHGCDHVDRNRGGKVSAEFAPDCPPAEVARVINDAWRRLTIAVDAAPVYAPPWNVLTANVRKALAATPLCAISQYGALESGSDDLVQINTHVDIMTWRPPRFRGSLEILVRLWRLLRARRKKGHWDEPVGLLTHHKNLDEEAWTFLEGFLKHTTRRTSLFQWRSVRSLVEAHREDSHS
jgi:hypothetical protein